MGAVITQSKYYSAIANAIRDNKEEEKTYTPAQMADEINNACALQYENGFREGFEAGHLIQTGVFTYEKDHHKITLLIPQGMKMLEIAPLGTPAESTSTRVPVSYLFVSEMLRNNNVTHENKGCIVQYNYSGYRTSFYGYDTTDGFTVDVGETLVFEAGMTYSWTAHFWEE